MAQNADPSHLSFEEKWITWDYIRRDPKTTPCQKVVWLSIHDIVEARGATSFPYDERIHSYLESMTNLRRKGTLSATLNQLKEEGIILREGNVITLSDEATLHSLLFQRSGNGISCMNCGKQTVTAHAPTAYMCRSCGYGSKLVP